MINGSNIRLPNGQFSTLVTPVNKDGVTQYVTPVDENGNVITGGGGGGGSTSPGGSNTQVQFNNSGSFAGDAGLTYVAGTDTLTTGNLNVTTAATTGTLAATTANVSGTATVGTLSSTTISNSGTTTSGTLIATSTIRNNGVETINSTSKPTTRVGGSALETGDKWYHPALQRDAYWDGTDWVSELKIAELPRFSAATTGVNATIQTSIPFAAGTVIKIKEFFISYTNGNADPAANFLTATLIARTDLLGTTSTDIGGAISANTDDDIKSIVINTSITLGKTSGQALTFGLRTALGAGTAPSTQIQSSFSYVVVF